MKAILVFMAFSLWWAAPVAAHLERETPAACELTHADGSPVESWQAMKGKVLYIDFWASWCPPCIKSFPFMNQLAQEYGERGLQVIGINLDEERPEADAFLKRVKSQFIITFNEDKQCAVDFGVIAMPSTYIVDKRGIVRHIHRGFRPAEVNALRELVEALLDEVI